MSREKAQNLVQDAGFKILRFELSLNPWVREKRLDTKNVLHDAETQKRLAYPDYQLFLVAEKPSAQ